MTQCAFLYCLAGLFPVSAAADYTTEFERLKRGPDYAADVPRGLNFLEHQPDSEDITYHYAVHVPEAYSPARRWPVHFYLHGGVNYSSKRMDEDDVQRFDELRVPGAISVYPSAWSHRKWWEKGQDANINAILRALKETYNIDENRVFVQGISDGGSGAYYIASHYPTAFAGFVALIGSVGVLNPDNRVHGTTFHNNFISRPIYALNTTRDRLYPADQQEKTVNTINEFGGDITWVVKSGKHNLEWVDEVRDEIHDFVADIERNPYPDHLRWQVDAQTPFRRLHWIIAGGAINEDKDAVVDVQKRDNDIFLNSVNMKDVTLLLSTEHFDFSKNIRIWIERTPVFNQKIAPSTKMLKKWYEIDRDRSMLFAAELRVALAAEPEPEPEPES